VNPPPAPRTQPPTDDHEIEVVYKKHPEQVAQERWVAMMKKEQLKRAQLKRVHASYRPAPRKQPEPTKQMESQPSKKKFKPAATITFDQ
jgi:ribosomal protein L13